MAEGSAGRGRWSRMAAGEAPQQAEAAEAASSAGASAAEGRPTAESAKVEAAAPKAEAGEAGAPPKESGEAKSSDTGEPRKAADVRPRFEALKRKLRERGVDDREAGRQAAYETIGSLSTAMEAQAQAQAQAWRSHEKIIDGLLGRLKDESDKRSAEVAALRKEIDALRVEMRTLTDGAKAKVEALKAAVEPTPVAAEPAAAAAPAEATVAAGAEAAPKGVTEEDLEGMSVQQLDALTASTIEALKHATPDQQSLMRQQIARMSVLKARKLQPEFAAKAKAVEKKQEEEAHQKEEEAHQKEEEAAREVERRRARDPLGVKRELLRAREFLFAAQNLEKMHQATPQAPELAKARQAVEDAKAIVSASMDLYKKLTGTALDYAALNQELDQNGIETARKELVDRGLEMPAIREYGPLDVLRQVVRLREIVFAADALTKSGVPEQIGLGSTAREAAQKELSAAMAEYKRQTGVELTFAYLNELLERDPKKLEASMQRSRELAEHMARAVRLDTFVSAVELAGQLWTKMRAAGGKTKAPGPHAEWYKATDAVKEAQKKLSPDQQAVVLAWRSGPPPAEFVNTTHRFMTTLKEDLLVNGFEISVFPKTATAEVLVEEEVAPAAKEMKPQYTQEVLDALPFTQLDELISRETRNVSNAATPEARAQAEVNVKLMREVMKDKLTPRLATAKDLGEEGLPEPAPAVPVAAEETEDDITLVDTRVGSQRARSGAVSAPPNTDATRTLASPRSLVEVEYVEDEGRNPMDDVTSKKDGSLPPPDRTHQQAFLQDIQAMDNDRLDAKTRTLESAAKRFRDALKRGVPGFMSEEVTQEFGQIVWELRSAREERDRRQQEADIAMRKAA